MSDTVQKSYTLSSKPQLIDLNGDSVNFELSFSATNTKGQDFYAVVVDQEILDSGQEPQYMKTEKGTISANIVSDSGTYTSYYLMLKSEKPCEVLVTISKQEVQQTKNNQGNQTRNREQEKRVRFNDDLSQSEKQQTKHSGNNVGNNSSMNNSNKEEKKSGLGKYMMPILIIGGLVAAGIVVYMVMKKKKTGEQEGEQGEGIVVNNNPIKPAHSSQSNQTPMIAGIPQISSKPQLNEGLMEKLNRLNIR